MKRCSAPWYELNVNAPDNYSSACCFYAEKTDGWQNGATLEHYWNSQIFQNLRKLHTDKADSCASNGCSNCYFFNSYDTSDDAAYYDFSTPPEGMSEAQSLNWHKAQKAFYSQETVADFTPLFMLTNFGYKCNYSCAFCHQVPRRNTWNRTITSDTIYGWEEALRNALSISVIGGEPFALPEALKFIRQFVTDESMQAVDLTIRTNGSILHKHIEALKQKDKISIGISLDGIGEHYNKWRYGGTWKVVERNLLMVRDLAEGEKPQWTSKTNCTVSKSIITQIEEYAEWHAENRIPTFFFDFINFRGTEDVFFAENIVDNPWLLEEVPNWQRKVENAIQIFEDAKFEEAVSTLKTQYDAIQKACSSNEEFVSLTRKIDQQSLFEKRIDCADNASLKLHFSYQPTPGSETNLFDGQSTPMKFTEWRPDDIFETDWLELETTENSLIRINASWEKVDGTTDRHAHLDVLFDDNNPVKAYRIWEEDEHERHLTIILKTMTKKRAKIQFKPTGEYVSYTPNRLIVETSESANFNNQSGVK